MLDLEARVQRLEEQMAKLGFGGPGGVIRTSALQIVDEQGGLQGELSMGRHGAHLVLKDAQSVPRAILGLGEQGPQLDLLGPDTKQRLSLSVRENGLPRLTMWDGAGQARLVFEIDSDEIPSLRLADAETSPRFTVMVGPDGMPSLGLSNAEGKVRVLLGISDEHSGLRVYDSHEQGRLLATVDADERPMIAMHDSQQVARLKITQMPDESPLLLLCNAKGHIRLSLSVGKSDSSVTMYDANQIPRAILSSHPDGRLLITDEQALPLATFPAMGGIDNGAL